MIDRNDLASVAVLALPGKPVNHVLHRLLSLFTAGLWCVVWIAMVVTQKKAVRLRVSVDRFGNYTEERMKIG